MKTHISILISLLLFCYAGALVAQPIHDTTQLWRVETNDGNNYIGHILDQDAEIILLRTEALGDIAIPKSEGEGISSRKTISSTPAMSWP